MAKEEKTQLDKDIADALKIMHKKFGEDSILTFDDTSIKKVDVISTGSLNLDVALGVGGLPEGRVNVIYGEPSSGKTTIAYDIVFAEAQREYLDSLNSEYVGKSDFLIIFSILVLLMYATELKYFLPHFSLLNSQKPMRTLMSLHSRESFSRYFMFSSTIKG